MYSTSYVEYKLCTVQAIQYATINKQIPVSPVNQLSVPQLLSSDRDCLVLPTDVSPVPHSFLLPSLLSWAATE